MFLQFFIQLLLKSQDNDKVGLPQANDTWYYNGKRRCEIPCK